MRRRHSGSAAEDDSDDSDDRIHLHTPSPDAHDSPAARPKKRSDKNDDFEAVTSMSPHDDQIPPPSSVTPAVDEQSPEKPADKAAGKAAGKSSDMIPDPTYKHRVRPRSPWSCSVLTLATTLFAFLSIAVISRSFLGSQMDPKGCHMSYMRAAFAKLDGFDTEHTRFASKYSLYLYREGGIDEDTRVKGIPVLFIPGNAGSYKQVRPIAAEAAYHFHDLLQHDQAALAAGKRSLDFFSVDFNEDITAFHGQTLLDQAEYLNDAISYILALYTDPHRSLRDSSLPDPTSVIVIGHSMGGIVARAMLIQPNYLQNSINTILTLSAPHARAPVSFDSTIVQIYKDINNYWRQSYAERWASKNPLWHVTLVSIAGGGLDNVVPSDYASLASLVPETHGFTVFTSSIPHVWTGMDHLAIMWCDQFRKAVVRALFDVVDVHRPSQTRSRADRINMFRKHFLTGLEPVIEKQLPAQETRLLNLDDEGTTFSVHKERLVLHSFGQPGKTVAQLMPMPVHEPFEEKRFTLLTDQNLQSPGHVEVYFCTIQPHQHNQAAAVYNADADAVNAKTGSTRLACKSAAADVVVLPGSQPESKYAFDQNPPMYFVEYDLAHVAEYNFVAVVDRSGESTPGWLMAEFASAQASESVVRKSLLNLLMSGVQKTLFASQSLVHTIHIPIIHSSLLAYKLSLQQTCPTQERAFCPLLRQYILSPYETKFFPNPADNININLHGLSPYITPPFATVQGDNGLSLQIWSDPACNGTTSIDLKVDPFGSAGKLYMRYRTVFAAFPLLVVALVIRKQFKIYNATGLFISFSESMDSCLRTSLPLIFLALTFMALSLSESRPEHGKSGARQEHSATETISTFTKNEMLLGSYDPFFWFLVPLFGAVSVGVCIALNYATLAVVHVFSFLYSQCAYYYGGPVDDTGRIPSFSNASTTRRVVTTGILILMITTIIPYQFAYLVLCIVQIATSTRALRLAWENRTPSTVSFHNYTHSLLVLLLWILPINMPVLVVWIHNLAVPYLTPFSSHHNLASILPYILLVETISSGAMIPRLTNRLKLVTNVLLFGVAVWAAMYGVTWAYTLHYAVNGVCGWLFLVHLVGGEGEALVGRLVGEIRRVGGGGGGSSGAREKRP